MKITEIGIYLVNSGNLRAFATIKLDCGISIRGAKVLESSKGLFVGWPGQKAANSDKYYDSVMFESLEEKQAFSAEILKAYEERKDSGGDKRQQKPSNSYQSRGRGNPSANSGGNGKGYTSKQQRKPANIVSFGDEEDDLPF